jgi:hypothetical protein
VLLLLTEKAPLLVFKSLLRSLLRTNPSAPTVCITVANGCPEHSVASATLASVSAPFQQQCQATSYLLFPIPSLGWALWPTRAARLSLTGNQSQSSIPDGHPILKGWQDLDGPRFWQFPLTIPPAPPAHSPPLAPIAMRPAASMSAFLPHPSQGFRATSATGEDVSVVFLHEATQSMAMMAQASSTPCNP